MRELSEPEHRRIAVFGGVYSNAQALRALLEDVRRRDVDALYCLGDVGGFGPYPDRVFPLLRDAGVHMVQGNYDASVGEGRDDCTCGYTDPRDNHFAHLSYVYTLRGTAPPHRAWLRSLPATRRVRLGERRLLLCHGSPRQMNEFLWESTTPVGLLRRLLRDGAADTLLCTHTGLAWHRAFDEGDAVNVGVLGRPPNDGRTDVWYAILTAEPALKVEFVPLAYDHEALAREIIREGLPPEFAETIRTGWWTTCLENLPMRERARGRY